MNEQLSTPHEDEYSNDDCKNRAEIKDVNDVLPEYLKPDPELVSETGEVYINEFHKEWNEACMRVNEKMRLKPYTLEQAQEQCRRLTERVERERVEMRRKRKN